MFRDQSLRDFCSAVAAKTPTPGGGSVSAVCAALAASLGAMAAKFPAPNGQAGSTESLARASRELEELARSFLELAEEDASAYDKVDQALRLPKGNEEEKAKRLTLLQDALRGAARVPLRGMQASLRSMEVLATIARLASPSLASDIAVAASVTGAGFHGCFLNVEVNRRQLERLGGDFEDAASVAAIRERFLKLEKEIFGALQFPSYRD